MNNFFESLKQYFESNSHDKVLEDWAKSESFDSIGPTVEEFMTNSHSYRVYSKDPSERSSQNIKNNQNLKNSSGFFINTKLKKNGKSSLFNRELSF